MVQYLRLSGSGNEWRSVGQRAGRRFFEMTHAPRRARPAEPVPAGRALSYPARSSVIPMGRFGRLV
jgi:hypothetical protein